MFPPSFSSSLFLLHRQGVGTGVEAFGGAVVVVFDAIAEGGGGAGDAVGVGDRAGRVGGEGFGERVRDFFQQVVVDGDGAVAGDVYAALDESFLKGHVVVEDEAEDLQNGGDDLVTVTPRPSVLNPK